MAIRGVRFKQHPCASPGLTEGVRNTVREVCFSSGWPAPRGRTRFPRISFALELDAKFKELSGRC
jgi:hypothetical protein